ncbi:MAG: bifunctional [glutamine synthetase] adenylyltransferase/[glutamine synthetase]-adenylyl-L-tyrosine phosphorylase [Pseudomonadota bacterium]
MDKGSDNEIEGCLWQRVAAGPLPNPSGTWSPAFDAFVTECAERPDLASLNALLARPGVLRCLAGVGEGSNYLMNVMRADPERLLRILACWPESHLQQLCADIRHAMSNAEDFSQAMRALRQFKTEVALLIGLSDLGGVFDVMTVTSSLSDACDVALQAAVEFLLREEVRKGRWQLEQADTGTEASGFIVLAMGKYGARELNYSSDIDLIVFFDRDCAEPRLAPGVEVQPFFVRLTRDLVRLMDERTSDGYVFRMDLRLRPDAGATQIALSTRAGLTYYESFGQNWERAALIKARVVAGDHVAGDAFLEDVKPFIWRRYLDYAAIADIHAMKRQINAFRGFGEIGVAGHDIKLGRGGIREIEFFVQTQQLIAGGRQPRLRDPQTRIALQALADGGWITQDVRHDLDRAYLFLRWLEHRIQMVGDEQTQTLPNDAQRLLSLSRFCGFEDTPSFSATVLGHLETVQRHYTRLFEDVCEPQDSKTTLILTGSEDDPASLVALEKMGFSNPAHVIETIRGWQSGRYAAVRSERSRERLSEVLPILIEALSKTADPEGALASFDRFMSELPTGIQLFALLSANPALLQLIADIMGTAPRLAHILSRRRRLLDAVIDPRTFATLPGREELDALVATEIGRGQDFEDMLNRARIVGSEQSFLIGIRVLSGVIDAGQAGGAYAVLAESLIDQLLGCVKDQLKRSHGEVQGGQVAVIAMGKLGGVEMTAASDVDLILVYDYPEDVLSSDGPKPLAPSQYYARMTQRLISALSAPTPEGQLYDVDLRLRPSGQQGPVATRFSSFQRYQAREAWTWEHLALTRARVVSGPPDLRNRISAAIADALSAPRERSKTATDVRDMRQRIFDEKGTDIVWDLKNVLGGMIDIEFMTQYLQLVHAQKNPDVLNTNTIAALENLKAANCLTEADAELIIPAARLYQNVQQVLRICTLGAFDPTSASIGQKSLLARAGGQPDFASLDVLLRETAARVAERFGALVQ